jgi:hypothetical protein
MSLNGFNLSYNEAFKHGMNVRDISFVKKKKKKKLVKMMYLVSVSQGTVQGQTILKVLKVHF